MTSATLMLLTRVMSVAAGTALITGALQVVINTLRHVLSQDFIWLSREYVWMTPAAYLILFAAVAVPVVLVGILWSRAADVRVAAFIFGTLGALGLVLLIPGLHHLAALALAVGVGTRVAAWIARDEPRWLRALRVMALGLAAALGTASVARAVSRARTERAIIAALPPSDADAPNVLVVIMDTVRAASMSFLGYPRATTPSLAQLSAQGAVFEQAFATAPWTLPSHAGMFTGLYPTQLSTDWRQPLDDAPLTLAEVLARRGYRTAGFVANHFYTSYESGLARGFEHYDDYRLTARQLLLSTTLTQTRLFRELLDGDGVTARLRALTRMDLRLQTMWTSHRKEAPEVTSEFLAWQAATRQSGRPFFAFLNYYDAHLPYDPPAPWGARFASDSADLDRYDGGIAYIDDSLGRLFRELERRAVLDRTLVIVSSDHGEAFGEHGLQGHGNSLYLPELHVPLLLRFPSRVVAGSRVSAPVTLRDMAATVLDAAGIAATDAPIAGTSWLGQLVPGRTGPVGSAVISEVSAGISTEPSHPVSRGPMRSLVTDSAHYIVNGDGVEEVYRWREDRGEARDVSASVGSTLLTALRAALAPGRR